MAAPVTGFAVVGGATGNGSPFSAHVFQHFRHFLYWIGPCVLRAYVSSDPHFLQIAFRAK